MASGRRATPMLKAAHINYKVFYQNAKTKVIGFASLLEVYDPTGYVTVCSMGLSGPATYWCQT